jgi:rhodanese-related sulfurtransferase
MNVQNLDAQDVARWLKEESIVLIDVREPAEYGAERIHGALLFPLSTFDPHALPDPGKRTVVFQCGSGIRSAKALQKCQDAGLKYECHLKGGIQAWKAAGLPTITVDPASGATRDPR